MLDAFANVGMHLHQQPDPCKRDPLHPFSATTHQWLSKAGNVTTNSFAPLLKWSAFKLMEWQYSGSVTKSAAELQWLVDIITDEQFKKEELAGFNVE